MDFGKLIHDQVPDKNGQTLPPGLTSGAYSIRDLADDTVANLYEGKVIVDKTFGHAAYGCMICCGPDSPWMQYDPLSLVPSGYANQQVQAVNSCSNQLVTVTGDFPTWWTDSTSIATASNNKITGVAVGSTNHNALSINMYWGPKEASNGGSCDLSQQQPSGGTNVTPSLLLQGNQYNSIFVGTDPNLAPPNSIFATVSPVGGAFTETSSVSADTFTPVASGGPGWVVNTTTQSTNTGDRKLTVTYTAGGQTASQSLNVTARQFAYLANDSPSNTCTLGYGTTYLYIYTPYTHPDKTAVPPGIGLTNTAVTESFNTQPPAGTVVGSGALDANSQFTDKLSYCSSAPLSFSTSITQTLSIEGYQVRQNLLTYSGSGITLTNQGPTQ